MIIGSARVAVIGIALNIAVPWTASAQTTTPTEWVKITQGDHSFAARVIAGSEYAMTCPPQRALVKFDPKHRVPAAPGCSDPLKAAGGQSSDTVTVLVVPTDPKFSDAFQIHDAATRDAVVNVNSSLASLPPSGTFRVIDLSSGQPLTKSKVTTLATQKKLSALSVTQLPSLGIGVSF